MDSINKVKRVIKKFSVEFKKLPNFYMKESEIQGILLENLRKKFPGKAEFEFIPNGKPKNKTQKIIESSSFTSLVHSTVIFQDKKEKIIDLIILKNEQKLKLNKDNNITFGTWDYGNEIDVAIEIKHQRHNRIGNVINGRNGLQKDYEKLSEFKINKDNRILLWIDNIGLKNISKGKYELKKNIKAEDILQKIKKDIMGTNKVPFHLVYVGKDIGLIWIDEKNGVRK